MTDDRILERQENGRRIEMELAQGLPLNRIFPVIDPAQRIQTPPPDLFADGHADFTGMDVPGGRFYVLDCQHGTSTRTLEGYTRDRDGMALFLMFPRHRMELAGAGIVCECWART